MRVRLSLAIVVLAAAIALNAQTPPRRPATFAPEGITPISLGLAGYAKVLCSAVFVSERDPAEAFRNSGFFLFPDSERAGVTYAVDRAQKLVRMTHGSITRTAKFYGDQGCIIHAEDRRHLLHAGRGARRVCRTRHRSRGRWATRRRTNAAPTGIDRAHVAKARRSRVRRSRGAHGRFSSSSTKAGSSASATCRASPRTRSSRAGRWARASRRRCSRCWSRRASTTSTIRCPVPEWRKPGDPRGAIRIVDLLHMSSGLRFIAGAGPRLYRRRGLSRSHAHLHRRDRRVPLLASRGRCSSRRTPKGAIGIPIR